ncbi:MAG: DUF1638 domain-containing protein [Desulfamplus sp.]|nr:DUF1638 domain-containing protein [Desulfamplus sp.]
MTKPKTVHLIGCGVLAPDIKHIAEELKHSHRFNLKMNFLPGGLHDKPNELRHRLQAAIDYAAKDKSCCRIIVGYGICGRGTVGINAPNVPLVFPRVHDCIALFLGSDQAYKKEFARYPGTFYLSAGWCTEKGRPGKKRKKNIDSNTLKSSNSLKNYGNCEVKAIEDNSEDKTEADVEHKIWIGSEPMGSLELKAKYGEEGGNRIIDFFSSWQKNYQRAAFIDTGLGNSEKYAQQAREMADEYHWKYEKIKGDTSLMRRLLTQDYSDDAILIVPPGYSTIYCAFKNSLDSAPVINSSDTGHDPLVKEVNFFGSGKSCTKEISATPANSGSRVIVYNEDEDKLLAIQKRKEMGGETLNQEKGRAVVIENEEEDRASVPPSRREENDPLASNTEEGRGLLIRYGLGIDAGGTYTDAVIYDFKEKKITHKNKALTTKWDFSIGIDNALSGLDNGMLSRVELVSVSTTLATNAIVEGEGQKTGLILMNSAGMVSDDLISHTPKCNVRGYINISGEEVEPVDKEQIVRVVRDMTTKEGVTAFAVSGFGGSINPVHEITVKQIVEQETGMVVCCGHELSDLLNFVVRAQTAVLNARIIPRMIKFFREIDQVLQRRSIAAPVMVVKGDGTLMSSEMAKERPVETILSGPAASVAGAKLLTGLSDAMVVDIGGTTTDTADICNNMVAVCESGAHVGGFDTHVKALDMRTTGLGGDSLIRWKQGEFTIGPRRVAPLVWAGSMHTSGVAQALFHMEQRSIIHIEQVLFVAMESDSTLKQNELKFPFKPTDQELNIYELLTSRPHTPEELATAMSFMSTTFLPMERLEESGLVQRCGLTPTDLLHARGDFTKWNPEPAQRMLQMMAGFNKITVGDLIDKLLKKMERTLALELLKKLILKDIRTVGKNSPVKNGRGGYPGDKNGLNDSDFTNSPVVRHLISSMLEPSLNQRYSIKAQFYHPVIGIGAPVHYFLPRAGEILNAKVIVPPDADVANALGAITSHIMIRKKIVIRPDSIGRFIIEGVEGNHGFKDIGEAEDWAVEHLKSRVISQAIKAGTSKKTVSVEINDRVVNTGNGLSLFLDRTLTATLTGSPDLVLESV